MDQNHLGVDSKCRISGSPQFCCIRICALTTLPGDHMNIKLWEALIYRTDLKKKKKTIVMIGAVGERSRRKKPNSLCSRHKLGWLPAHNNSPNENYAASSSVRDDSSKGRYTCQGGPINGLFFWACQTWTMRTGYRRLLEQSCKLTEP